MKRKNIQEKALRLAPVLLDRPKKEQIREYCKELGYVCNLSNDLPRIRTKDRKKAVYIQTTDKGEMYVVEGVPMSDKKMNIIKIENVIENMTEKLQLFNMYKLAMSDMESSLIKSLKESFEDKSIKELFGIQYFYSDLKPRVVS